ncbi:NADH-ubiquinone oxidoreductase subunit [Pleurostoma richardsiae]|uniref:NADH-ubiquinone oxidoreductase subunit n=1 Tax=Pleurostoma richardsiae TaxID=41990 RepID=A0AA38VUK6_9PEZI|nr:NADH-ubiquinone oxidoreductase subunit [Pleurostoma richardsiae]
MAPSGEDQYHPVDAIKAGASGTLVLGAAGVFAAAVQTSLAKRNVGAWSVFTRGGGTIATFAAAGGVYEFSKAVAANLREKKDAYNEGIAGFLAGSIVGLRAGRMPAILGCGATFAVLLSAYEYTGGSLRGYSRDPEADEFDRKEKLRLNRRRPIEETIAEVGEGRASAIHPPGYEERRRERIKEKYGIEINPVSAQ